MASADRLVIQRAHQVGAHLDGAAVSLIRFLLNRLAYDGVDVASQRILERLNRRGPIGGHELRALGRHRVGNGARKRWIRKDRRLREQRAVQTAQIQWQRASKKLGEHDAERVHISARVNAVDDAHDLLRTRVGRGADQLSILGEVGHVSHVSRIGHVSIDRFGDAEVDDLWRWRCHRRHNDVGRLEIAMNDAARVRMLYAVAHRDEEPDAIVDRHARSVAVVDDRRTVDVLHCKVGTAMLSHARVVHMGNIHMLHERERLLLGLKSSDRPRTVNARLEHLERNKPSHRLRLLGEIDIAKATFADERTNAIATDELGVDYGVVHGLGVRFGHGWDVVRTWNGRESRKRQSSCIGGKPLALDSDLNSYAGKQAREQKRGPFIGPRFLVFVCPNGRQSVTRELRAPRSPAPLRAALRASSGERGRWRSHPRWSLRRGGQAPSRR